jgi:A/G-specific adenine glycosylase
MDIEDLGRWNTHKIDVHGFNDWEETAQLQTALLAWYRSSRRKLPWRGDGPDGAATSPVKVSPYATWVSEVMLQQTRVEAVITVRA